jgi:hypothetical protein
VDAAKEVVELWRLDSDSVVGGRRKSPQGRKNTLLKLLQRAMREYWYLGSGRDMCLNLGAYASSLRHLKPRVEGHEPFGVFSSYRLGPIFQWLGEQHPVHEIGMPARQFVQGYCGIWAALKGSGDVCLDLTGGSIHGGKGYFAAEMSDFRYPTDYPGGSKCLINQNEAGPCRPLNLMLNARESLGDQRLGCVFTIIHAVGPCSCVGAGSAASGKGSGLGVRVCL